VTAISGAELGAEPERGAGPEPGAEPERGAGPEPGAEPELGAERAAEPERGVRSARELGRIKAISGPKSAIDDNFCHQNAFCHQITSSVPSSANR